MNSAIWIHTANREQRYKDREARKEQMAQQPAPAPASGFSRFLPGLLASMTATENTAPAKNIAKDTKATPGKKRTLEQVGGDAASPKKTPKRSRLADKPGHVTSPSKMTPRSKRTALQSHRVFNEVW